MAVLISSVSELLHDPGGLWELLILKVFKFIGNYGWRILFFTICLKLLLFPLDLYQRLKMRKNQLISERIKPQMEKLQQQYAGDKQVLAQKQMELNKREGFSYFSSCLPMLVTLVIFFYLFAGLNNISQYKNFAQYVQLYDAYTAVETVEADKELTVGDKTYTYKTLGARLEYLNNGPNAGDYKNAEGEWGGEKGDEAAYNAAVAEWTALKETEAYRTELDALQVAESQRAAEIKKAAQAAVNEEYGKTKESFLWVRNIWSPDVPWRKAVLSYSQFKSNVGDYAKYNKVIKKLKVDSSKLTTTQFQEMMNETTYNNVTGALRSGSHNRTNGFLILPILSVALSFLSQFISNRLQKQSGQVSDAVGGGSMKFMMFLMPIMMGFFALTYTSAFTLYIVVNSGITILINVITTVAMNGKSKRVEKSKTTGVQKYGRPDPKDL